MQIEVAKRYLVEALKVAATAMSTLPTKPIETHYVFRVQDGKAQVLASSKRTFCGTPMTCRAAGDDGAFTIEGWRLRQWLQAVGDVAIAFKFDNGVVEVSTPRGKMSFPSLDPAQFPYFDQNIETAEPVATLNGARLAQVLTYVQPLILDRESTHAQMSLTEVQEGALYATNIETMTVVRMTEPSDEDGESTKTLEQSQMRVHVKDVKHLQSFLKLDSEGAVEILEDKDTCLILRRPDGSVFGAARPSAGFPKFPDVGLDTTDDTYFSVATDEITSALTWLQAGAKKDADSARFRWKDGSMILAMESASGGEVTLPIELIEHDGLDEGMPPIGFKVLYSYITLLAQHFKSSKIRFGVLAKRDDDGEFNGKGYIRFRNEDGGDTYQTLVAWL